MNRLRFLIVDDSDADRFLNRRVLKKSQLALSDDDIREAADGREALEILQTEWADQGCVVLLDINMPVMNGFEFLQNWERSGHAADQDVHIVMVTSSQHDAERQRAIAHKGVVGFMTKPLERLSFSSFINDALQVSTSESMDYGRHH